MNDAEKHWHCTNKFVDLANELQKEDFTEPLISAAMMAASGIYATYIAAGNTGGLEPTGVNKVVAAYRNTLEQVQASKKRGREEIAATENN